MTDAHLARDGEPEAIGSLKSAPRWRSNKNPKDNGPYRAAARRAEGAEENVMSIAQDSDFPNTTPPPDGLSPKHVAYLKERAVDPHVARYAAGVCTVTASEGAQHLGFARPLASAGLLVPYHNVPGYVRVRVDDDGAYLVPAGQEVPIYIPNGFQADASVPMFVVEGPIKALALQDHGFNAVALGGVTTTLTKDHKLNASWEAVTKVRREVFIVFDANRANNVDVARAEARLGLALESEGAKVRVVALPLRDGGKDQGPDDFLALNNHDEGPLRALVDAALPADPVERARLVTDRSQALILLENLTFLLAVDVRGTVAQEKVFDQLAVHNVSRTLLRQAVKRARESGKRSTAREPTGETYQVRERRMCLVTSGGPTEKVEPIANFTAEIVEDRTLDDGSTAPTRAFMIEGAYEDGTPFAPVSVSPQELVGDVWPLVKLGPRAIVTAGISRAAHHLRNAIAAMSTSTSSVVAYAHTGFRQRDGIWFYLHGGGAVGASDVTVALDGVSSRFVLPDEVVDVVGAVRESLEFIQVAASRITRPLHAAVYRAPLSEALRCDGAVCVYGDTGALKSAIAAIVENHWGEFDYNSLPMNWESTANAIEADLFRAKDVLVVIDEFVPRGELYEELQRKVERVVRAIGNGSSRGRLNADLSARPERPCRGLVLITGEDLPRGESVQARLVAIRVERGDVNTDRLSARQRGRTRLRHAMLGYIQWLSPRMSELKVEVPKRYLAFRDELHGVGHLRAPSAMAHVLVGAYYFAEFAKHLGVMTAAEAEAHVESTRTALLENAKEQVRATEQSNPARRFMDVLRGLYARGVIALKPVGEALKPFNKDGAAELGWKDLTYAYFEANAVLAAVNKDLAAMGERMPLQAYGLWKQLASAGFIVPKGTEVAPKFCGDNKTRVRVLQVQLATLVGPNPDPGDGHHDDHGPRVTSIVARQLDLLEPSGRSAHVPKIRPEDSALSGGGSTDGISQSTQPLAASEEAPMEGSAQEPTSLGERDVKESDFRPPDARAHAPLVGAPLSPGNTRASGRTDSDELAEAMLWAGKVGLATGKGDQGPVMAVAVPGWGVRVIELPASRPVGLALGRVQIVGHDLKPTVALLQRHDINPNALFDTKIAWQLLDGHQHDSPDFFSLENACTTMRVAAVSPGTPVLELLQAEAQRVLVFEADLREALWEEGLEEVSELEFALLPIVAEMETTGVPVDGAAWKRVTSEWTREANALRKSLVADLGVRNVDDDKQVLAALRALGLAVQRTSGEALAAYSDNPIVENLVRYRRLVGFVRSSGKGVLQALERSKDGRVHASVHQLGARTGRMSCSEPNLMGLPRASEIRACIVAPAGKKLVVGDYNAIEMRVIAEQTGDQTLREVFAELDGDPHRHTASVLLGKPSADVTNEERRPAKAVNFGLSFGMGTKTLVAYARKNFKVVVTETEAEAFRTAFFAHYAGVREWHETVAREMPTSLRTASGRITYYLDNDEGFNARLSFPIQGTAADGMKAAIVFLHPRLARLGARIVLVVHDELVVEAPEEHAEEVRVVMRENMIAGMRRYVPNVPILVEPEVRSTWAK